MNELIDNARIDELRSVISSNANFTLKMLIDEFISSASENINKLEASLKEESISNYKSIIHTIKGAALNFGASRLANQCIEAETLIASDKITELTSFTLTIMKTFEETVTALKDLKD